MNGWIDDYFVFDETTKSLIPKERKCAVCSKKTDYYKYLFFNSDRRLKKNRGKPKVVCYICNSCWGENVAMEWDNEHLKIINVGK